MFERRIDVVCDIGIDPSQLGKGWTDGLAGLQASVTRGADFARFVEALRGLGPVLASVMPRAEDDVNELPDEVDAT